MSHQSYNWFYSAHFLLLVLDLLFVNLNHSFIFLIANIINVKNILGTVLSVLTVTAKRRYFDISEIGRSKFRQTSMYSTANRKSLPMTVLLWKQFWRQISNAPAYWPSWKSLRQRWRRARGRMWRIVWMLFTKNFGPSVPIRFENYQVFEHKLFYWFFD